MENYKSNSHRSREKDISEKKTEKVISGTAKVKKKSGLNKLTDIFLSEDIANVKNYIFADVLVPAIKKAISDTVTNGVDLMLYGEAGRTKKGSNVSKISYWNGRNGENRHNYNTTVRSCGFSFDDIVLENRGEAEAVLARMDEIIDIYGILSVGDFYDLVGITGNYTDNKYGWNDIRSVYIMRVRDGYMIKMPKAKKLRPRFAQYGDLVANVFVFKPSCVEIIF